MVIPEDIYKHVMRIKQSRESLCEMMNSFKNRDKKIAQNSLEYVFSFRNQDSFYQLVKRFRREMENRQYLNASSFTIHDCRRASLRDIHDQEGLDIAKTIAQHSDSIITRRSYLDLRTNRKSVRGFK